MVYYKRLLEQPFSDALNRGKSVLLLGPRQTGKTTFIKNQCRFDLYYNLLLKDLRLRFEQNPDVLIQEIKAFKATGKKPLPLIVIDEIQKVPEIVDAIQYMIDEKIAQFVLTGSSARKLGGETTRNLLPGRIVKLHLDALCLAELPQSNLGNLLLFGSLPHIFLEPKLENKENDLLSYVETYLEEEIRIEAAIRNLGSFTKFLQFAGTESGAILNINKLSQDIGVNRHKIMDYYQILKDCMIIDSIPAITNDHSRRRLAKAEKYLFFDLGIRRLCAQEAPHYTNKMLGKLFEQFIGMELQRYIRLFRPTAKLKYWRDHAGPEIDYVIDLQDHYCPIEIKWTELPRENDCKHLITFMTEYPTTQYSYIVCRTPRAMLLNEKVIAIPWQELFMTIGSLLKGETVL